jgi:hypothetical protein
MLDAQILSQLSPWVWMHSFTEHFIAYIPISVTVFACVLPPLFFCQILFSKNWLVVGGKGLHQILMLLVHKNHHHHGL